MKTHIPQWAQYWKTGVLTSLPQDFEHNYSGEIYDFWYKQVNSFEDNSVVLDVCTGNGAIAIMIKEIANKINKRLNVIAIDGATIDTKTLVKCQPKLKSIIEEISFIGEVQIEEIDVAIKKQVDYIVSQYGIEYCKIEVIAPKISKILKSCGKLIFISHAAETDIHNYMKIEQEHFYKLKKIGVFKLFKKFIANKEKPQSFISKLNICLNEIEDIFGNSLNEYVYEWAQTMQMLARMPKHILLSNRKQIKEFYYLHLYARMRSDDLLSVSKKLKNNPKWYNKFIESGLSLKSHGELTYQSRHKVGQYYEFIHKGEE